jgi:HD-GYP domain-containing protein (c-di-GMP phosphodiesterase class II)
MTTGFKIIDGGISIYDHIDFLSGLNSKPSLSEKLEIIHNAIRKKYRFIDRVAITSYDSKTDQLKTLAASGNDQPISHYTSPMSEAPSLQEVLKIGRPRVVNDLSIFSLGKHTHTKKIKAQGYCASYTMPMYLNGLFGGFIFFNSYRKDCFLEDILQDLDVFGHLIASIVINEVVSIKTMLAALKTANEMVHFRDPETGGHLDRMSRISRLIAQELAQSGKYKFNDEFIEHIFLFSPLHDIGKIGIPDNVLLKPTRLNEKEFEIMKTHAAKGRQMIDSMIKNFGLESFNSVNVLRNIAEYHHEALDGTGYPHGLKDKEIPIEARIIAVADIFDALANERCYKQAWGNDKTIAMLRCLAIDKLDQDCVEALIKNRDKIEQLQAQFKD